MTINPLQNEANNQAKQNDSGLVFFLKQHHPIAPTGSLNLESKLIFQINLETAKNNTWQRLSRVWLIPLFLVSGIAIWTVSSISDRAQFQPSMANRNSGISLPINAQESQQLEASLVKDWLISSGEDVEEVNSFYLDR